MAKLINNNHIGRLFAKVWFHSQGRRKTLILFWIMFVFAETLQVVLNPFIWASILKIIQNEGIKTENINTLMWLLAALLGANILFWCIHGPARVMECNNAFLVRVNYRKHMLKGVFGMPLSWHAEHVSGDTIDKVEKGAQGLASFADNSYEVIYAVVKFVMSYTMLVYFFPSSAFIVLIMMVVTIAIAIKFDRFLIGVYSKLNKAENHVSASVFDSISNITTVIILRVEKLVFDSIVKKAETPIPLDRKSNAVNEFKWFITSVFCTLTTILVLAVYFRSNIGVAGGILIGNVYLLYRYLGNISEIFSGFTNLYGNIVKYGMRVQNSELLALGFGNDNLTNHVLPKDWRKLHISKLNFTYDSGESENKHLENVDLSIRRGEKIAFVGESGSGKTTLLKLIRGLYIPEELELSVDGQVIQDGFDGIARAIALAPQNPELFATTVLENITLGSSVDIDRIRRYTDMACFTDVALSLPNGFDSVINEKGVNLSGGQQQRLALARGLMACEGKDLILLDEPTSSLDAVTELTVYRNILNGFREKTVISSVHRLHLLSLFDRICVFENGKIVGSGTLQEVRTRCEPFRLMWEKYTNSDDIEVGSVD